MARQQTLLLLKSLQCFNDFSHRVGMTKQAVRRYGQQLLVKYSHRHKDTQDKPATLAAAVLYLTLQQYPELCTKAGFDSLTYQKVADFAGFGDG